MKSQFQALMIIAIAGGSLFAVLTVSGALAVPCGCGTSAVPLPGCVEAPCPAREMIVIESYNINSPTNVTLILKNTGWIVVYLAAYKVTNANGVYFANSSWTGPAINPNYNATANILIDGKSFTFQSSPSYTISITTTRSNQFQFTIY